MATQDTVTQIISAIRRVIREVPGAQETAAEHCRAHDYTDPGKPKIAWDNEAARSALVDALVTDALNLLGHLPEQNLGEKAANALGLLALVAGQDVEPAEDSDGRWRIARRTVADRTVSTADPDARHIHKNRTRHQDGFKGHASFEPESSLFTAVALTSGYGPDNHEAAVACDLLADKDQDGELTVLGDSAYGTGNLRAQLQADGHTLVIKPPPLRQAVPSGFTIDDFHIDPVASTATCPAQNTANLGRSKADGARTTQFKRVCTGCPLRERCTTSQTGRTLNVHPQYELLAAARAQTATDTLWQDEYRRWRPSVERAIARLVAKSNRRVPYRGVIANNIWLHHRAAALNLRRLINLGLTRTNTTWHLTPATT